MRDLNIAYGNNRQAKRWVNKTITFDELKEKLKVPIRTTESAEEYAKMSKAQRDNAKDHGGFVGGVLKDGRRKIDTVAQRSMVTLSDLLNVCATQKPHGPESLSSLLTGRSRLFAIFSEHSSRTGTDSLILHI